MKKSYCLLTFIVLHLTLQCEMNAQSGWFWQNPLPTGNSLNDVSFSDPHHGFVVGDAGTILYTSDGGES